MATAEDDGIEILSCHIEHDDEDDDYDTTDNSASVSIKIANGGLSDDPVSAQRKRVARAVGIVTFILLLFSIVLIGVSLNMSKNIDEMAGLRAVDKNSYYKPSQSQVAIGNSTDLDHDSDLDLHH